VTTIPVLPAPTHFDRAWASALVLTLNAWAKALVFGDRTIQGKLMTESGRISKGTLVTAATYTVRLDDEVIDVNRAGAVTLTMPLNPGYFQRWYVQDSSGDAANNTITIAESSAKQINGGASVTLTTNYGRRMIVYNGTQFISA
jgi:hypothetical protein